MSENQGERPTEPTTGDSQAAGTPPAAAPEATAPPTAAPQQPLPPRPAPPVPPVASASQAWHAPHQSGQPGAYPAYPQQPHGYGVPPQGRPAQPGYAAPQGPQGPHSPQSTLGPHGPQAPFNQTLPTVPLDTGAGAGATGAPGQATANGTKTKDRSTSKVGAGKVTALIVAAALVGGAAGLGGAYAGVNLFSPAGTAPLAGPSTITVNDTDNVNQTTAIAAKVVPSVVTISVSGGNNGGTGSGVILTEDGYVVTNTHVVTLDGATADAAVRVTTADGRVYDAEIVGTDPIYDLAVIKMTDASGLTPIEFADSSKLNVGDETIAVGAPLGLANTVTTGIVSALNRSIQIASSAAPDNGDQPQEENPDEPTPEDQIPPFFFDFGQGDAGATPSESISIAVIQTDAAINPGNSGGALVDNEGRLIGVNVAIATAGGSSDGSGSIGVGFSIPSEIVQRVTDELIESGVATHGLLGASVQSAEAVQGSTISGAYIAEVTPDGAAAGVGLQQGDIVTEFNGIPITDSVDLTAQVRAAAAGSDATVTYVRDGETHTVDVTLGSLG